MERKVIWSKGPWERRDNATVMSGRVVRYNLNYGKPYEQEVSASRDAVCITNVDINPGASYSNLLDILDRAMRQHLHLRLAHGNNPLPEKDSTEVPK